MGLKKYAWQKNSFELGIYIGTKLSEQNQYLPLLIQI